MRKLKMQILVLAMAFAAAVAAKMYVDRYLNVHASRSTVVSEAIDPAAVSLPEPEKKM